MNSALHLPPKNRPSAATGELTIRINDEPRVLTGPTTLAALLGELGLGERAGVAVAVNQRVVPRGGWAGRALAEGDRVLVIRAAQGG